MGSDGATVNVLLVGTRLLIAGVLLRAVLGKLRAPTGTIESVNLLLRLKTAPLGSIVVGCVIGAEAAVGYALLAGVAPTFAAAGFVVMLISFNLASIALRSIGADGCNCFGDDGPPGGRTASVRNVLLAVAALAIVAASVRGPTAAVTLPVWNIAPQYLLFSVVVATTLWLSWSMLTILHTLFREAGHQP